MITLEEISIERTLEHEPRTMQRQKLLKELWKLRQSQAVNEKNATAADEVNGQTPHGVPSRPMTLTSSVPRDDETATLQA